MEVEGISITSLSFSSTTVRINYPNTLQQKPTLAQQTMSPVEGSPAKPEDYPHFMSVYVLIPIGQAGEISESKGEITITAFGRFNHTHTTTGGRVKDARSQIYIYIYICIDTS